jgi:hypothetical protein
MITLESYQQTYAYDTGNNLTNLSHQANSNTWQQTLTIHPQVIPLALYLAVRFNHAAASIALVIIDIVLCGVAFVCFSKLVKGVVVVPMYLHIGTYILSENSKNNTQSPNQTRYQLTSHLQSNTLELDDKAQTLSYEHYYPYGGTALFKGIIAHINIQIQTINCPR